MNLGKIKSLKTHVKRGLQFNKLLLNEGIKSPQEAWFLGVAYGDGAITQITKGQSHGFRLSLQYVDIDVLEKIASNDILGVSAIDNGISIQWQKSPTLRRRPMCSLSVYNKQFATQLSELGCTRNKAKTLVFPYEFVPEEYMMDFVRGYVDADGALCLRRNGKAGIHFHASCHQFLDELREFLSTRCDISKPKLGKGNGELYHLEWAAKNDLNNILHKLYGNWLALNKTN